MFMPVVSDKTRGGAERRVISVLNAIGERPADGKPAFLRSSAKVPPPERICPAPASIFHEGTGETSIHTFEATVPQFWTTTRYSCVRVANGRGKLNDGMSSIILE